MINIILKGRPITKKNHQRIVVAGNRRFVVQSKRYLEYESDCLWQIRDQCDVMTKEKVSLQVLYYLPDKRSRPDLINLLQATCDILEKGRVIENDRNIVSFDGSRIIGIDSVLPRAEIYIKAYGIE